ncbi:MAG: hypothetical protein MI921_23935, partial [Cytophagales bacterium]|nr:hypothetical protein [Cytophagales bacterium]
MSKNLKTEYIFYTFSVLSCVGKRGLIAVLWAVFGFIPSFLHGQVVVTPPSAVSLCVGGDYVNVGNIVITETNPNDIVDNGTGFTYILSLPSADYEFEDNIGTIAITGGNRLSAISMDVDPGSITVTFDHSPGGTSDEFTISNLRIRAVSFGLAGELRRTGGTSTQSGNQPSDNQNHLSLSTFITSLTVDAGGPQAICDGASVNIGGSPTASGGTGPYTYVWSPTTDLDDFTDPNPDAIPTTTTIYTAIVSDATGCTLSDNMTLTVNPIPAITNPSVDLFTTICSGESLNFIPNSSVGGTTYSWTSSTSGTISGVSVTGSGTGAIMDTPINTGSVSGTVTYTITPTASGCSGTPVDYVVTVDPLPDATASDATLCSGETSNVLISNPNGVTGTTFSWVVHSSTNVSGATGGSGSLIGQTLTSSDMINSGSVTYRITPMANSCSGAPFDVTVTVNPIPEITNIPASLSTTICSGLALNFLPGSNIIGTTYSWTSSTSGTILGASVTASGTGTITDIPINTGNTPGTVTYTITPTAGGCSGTPVDYVVTV